MRKVYLGIGFICIFQFYLNTVTVVAAEQSLSNTTQSEETTAATIISHEESTTSNSSVETSDSGQASTSSEDASQTDSSNEEATTVASTQENAATTTIQNETPRSSLERGYATISIKEASLYDIEEKVISTDLTAYYQQTYQIQASKKIDNQTVFALWSNQHTFIGYVPDYAVALSSYPIGTSSPTEIFGNLTTKSIVYQDLGLSRKVDMSTQLDKTFFASECFHHYDGTVYIALTDQNKKTIGYLREEQFQIAKGPQGNYQSYGKYVTIPKDNLDLWQNFNWVQKNTTKSLVGKTYLAKGKYVHYNGNTYLSLYDSKNKWIGYIAESKIKTVATPQGNYQSYKKYVTITSKNYDLWQNFTWKSKNKSKNLIGQTVYAKGRYQHFNGSVYLSLYDRNDRWLGYLNQNASAIAAGKQGIYQSYGKTVTITKNYPLWQNYSWQKKNTGQNYYNQLLTARGMYKHFNGSIYLSLYTDKGKWIGYINQNGVKLAHSQKDKLKKVQNLLNKSYKNSNMSIYVMSLIDGETASRNSTLSIHPASTGKLPALYYTQKMILEKKLDGNKKYTYKDAINQMTYSYMRGGAGILQGKKFGQQFSLKQIQTMTARYSDNQGANFLGYYGANQYDQKMRNEISRIIGRKWTGPFKINAKENALLMQAIYNQGGQLINDLSNTIYDNQRIAKYLPVKVAHKIGDLTSVAHDIAIVYADQPYVLSVMTRNTSYETIAKLSKQIYDIMK